VIACARTQREFWVIDTLDFDLPGSLYTTSPISCYNDSSFQFAALTSYGEA